MPTIKTRQTADGRSTVNSEKRGIVDSNEVVSKKKKKLFQDLPKTPIRIEEENIFLEKENSGTSSSSSDEEGKDNLDNNTKMVAKKTKEVVKEMSDNNEIIADEKDNDIDDDTDDGGNANKRKKYVLSYLSVNRKSKINLYVRNELFKKIKIVGNEHLQDDGQIMKEVFKRIQCDPKFDNFNLLSQECKFLIKQTMCSRRGYVKKKIGKKLRGTM